MSMLEQTAERKPWEQEALEQLKADLDQARLENWMIRLGVYDDVDLDVLGAIAWDDGERGRHGDRALLGGWALLAGET